ncbi:MAG: sensor histidine kinase [Candidatus Altimarinota bacterium]
MLRQKSENLSNLSEYQQKQIKTAKYWLHDNAAVIGNIAILAALNTEEKELSINEIAQIAELTSICEKTATSVQQALNFSRSNPDSNELFIYLTTFREQIRQDIASIMAMVKTSDIFDQEIKEHVQALKYNENDLHTEALHSFEISEIISRLSQEYAKGLIVTLNYDNQPIHADKAHLIRIFINIFSNARKYTPAGTTLNIEIKKQNQETLISITDNGPGFSGNPQKLLALHSQDKSEHASQGHGIGLSYCHDAIQDHGGRLQLFNRADLPGETKSGAVFLITLPDPSPRQSQVTYKKSQPEIKIA